MKCRQFTLVECLCVMAVTIVVLTAAGRVFYDASLANRQFTSEAWTNQRMLMLHDDWEQFVHGADPDDWSIDGPLFLSGKSAVKAAEGKVTFELNGRKVARTMPVGATVAFAIEGEGEGRYAVMTVSWSIRLRHRDTPQQVRLVAAPLEVGR